MLTAQDAGRCSLSDREQLEFATANDYVMVSFDADFLALDASGVAHAGIVWCPAAKHSIGELIQALLLVYGVLGREEMRDHVEHL